MQSRLKQNVAKTEILNFINSPYAESGELLAHFCYSLVNTIGRLPLSGITLYLPQR
jgi:hypothetical protein